MTHYQDPISVYPLGAYRAGGRLEGGPRNHLGFEDVRHNLRKHRVMCCAMPISRGEWLRHVDQLTAKVASAARSVDQEEVEQSSPIQAVDHWIDSIFSHQELDTAALGASGIMTIQGGGVLNAGQEILVALGSGVRIGSATGRFQNGARSRISSPVPQSCHCAIQVIR